MDKKKILIINYWYKWVDNLGENSITMQLRDSIKHLHFSK